MAQEKLIDFIKSKEFGNGKTSVVAYTTAWAARVKKPGKPTEPAFPEALNWLRNNQLSDGSWGVGEPFNIFDRMLSTFTAVICLKEWNHDQDQTRIDQAVTFIKENWEKLIFYGRIPWQMTVGFELIFPTLVEQASKLLEVEEFGTKDVLDNYVKEKEKKLKKIRKKEEKEKENEDKNKENAENKEKKENKDKNKENEISDLKSWYYSLESFDNELYQEFAADKITKMVDKNNLVATSYAVTAFALTKGENLPDSYKALQQVISARGGVPATVHLNIFDLSWSLNYMIWAGVDMKQPCIQSQLDKLEKIWKEKNGLLPGCDGLPPDADDTANALHALLATGRVTNVNQLSGLMKFWDHDMFVTYEGEHWKARSVSANLNCLLALKHFAKDETLSKQYKDFDLLKYQKQVQYSIDDTGFDMEDKWHLSKYYCLSRAVFAFEHFDLEYTDICYRIMLHFQNDDGGWGTKGVSTPAETAYCLIAILYWYKKHDDRLVKVKHVPPIPALPIIKKAKMYMEETEEKIYPLWLEKVPYCMYNVDKTAILAAKYALAANEQLIK